MSDKTVTISFEIDSHAFEVGDRVVSTFVSNRGQKGVVVGYASLQGDGYSCKWGYVVNEDGKGDTEVYTPNHLVRDWNPDNE